MVLSKEKYGTLAMWKVDDRVLEALNETGLEHFHHVAVRLGKNQHDNRLLEALVGLEDVVYITVLRVKGDLVRKTYGYPVVEGDEQHMDVPGLGKVDKKALRGENIRLGYMRDTFSKVKEENELDKYVNAYILYLVGTVILPTNNSYVCLGYLDSICDGKFKRSTWGVAMLAHIHYCVQEGGKNIGGAKLLVMISAFKHLPDLVDSFFKPFDLSKNLPNTFPLSKDWAMHISGALVNRHRHRHRHKELDYTSLLDGRVTWKPYSRFHDNNILPEEIRGDLEMKFYRGVLPHPHHNSFIANHRPDHCPKHLGFDVEVGHCPELIDVCTNWKILEAQWKNRECMVRPRMVNGGDDLEPQMVTDGERFPEEFKELMSSNEVLYNHHPFKLNVDDHEHSLPQCPLLTHDVVPKGHIPTDWKLISWIACLYYLSNVEDLLDIYGRGAADAKRGQVHLLFVVYLRSRIALKAAESNEKIITSSYYKSENSLLSLCCSAVHSSSPKEAFKRNLLERKDEMSKKTNLALSSATLPRGCARV
ncbi:hypothetical protein ACLB2K_045558 [Fragaria x ananassa]